MNSAFSEKGEATEGAETWASALTAKQTVHSAAQIPSPSCREKAVILKIRPDPKSDSDLGKVVNSKGLPYPC